MAEDEARKANRNLKSQTLSNWDFLLNAMGTSEKLYEGGKFLF